MGVELVEHVQRRDREDVAGAHHHGDAGGLLGRAQAQPGVLARLRLGDAGFHPHLRPEAAEQQPVEHVVRQHVDGDPPTGRGPDRVPSQQIAALRQPGQGLGQRLGVAEHGPGAAGPLLTEQRRGGGQLLDLPGDAYPLFGVGGDVGVDLQQQGTARGE